MVFLLFLSKQAVQLQIGRRPFLEVNLPCYVAAPCGINYIKLASNHLHTMTSEIQSAQALLRSYASLTTVTEAGSWCETAEKCIEELEFLTSQKVQKRVELGQLASGQRQDTKDKSFMGRFFKSTEEKATHSNLESLRGLTDSSRKLAERLQELVDLTPRTKEEQASLVKELKLSKKELQLQKKEVSAEMKGIQTEARQKSASASTSFTTLLVGQKYTAAERRSIRQSKERALSPHEDAKSAIERQILVVEKEILRLESFR